RHRRRSRGQLQRHRRGSRVGGGCAAADRHSSVGAAADDAVHGAPARGAAAALECPGEGGARVAAAVSGPLRGAVAGGVARRMTDRGLAPFQEQRPRLFAVAYRMLGSASDAEDVVQDAWLRYSTARPAEVRSPKAFLTTVVTRLCLDRLKSARATREEYVGPWLPEPMVPDAQPGRDRSMALAESVTLAFMVLLETLSPEERAVFLLREVFEHDYPDIAEMLDTTPANCRQLFHRAKERIADRRPRFRDAARAKRPLVERFVQALRAADPDALAS